MNNTIGKKVFIGCSAIALVVSTQTVATAAPSAQWATSATATTEYLDYEATKLVGAPNAAGCGNGDGLWSAAEGNTVDAVTLTYASAVIPTSIKVHQNNTQGAVSKIEVSANGTTWKSVYIGDPTKATEGTCDPTKNYNDVLTVAVKKVNMAVNTVRVTVDQSTKEWAEIDAVQLVGKKSQTIPAVPSSLKLKKTTKLPDKTNKKLKVTWKSTTPAVCTVSSGTLKAVAKGTCNLTGTSAEDAAYGVVVVNKSVTVKK